MATQLLQRFPQSAASAAMSAFNAAEWGDGRPSDQAAAQQAQAVPRVAVPPLSSGGLSAAFASRSPRGEAYAFHAGIMFPLQAHLAAHQLCFP